MNRFWWQKFLNWLFVGEWQPLVCTPCKRGIHVHDDVKTMRCITRGCDCKTEVKEG
jgi:hypothetical protein